jgi:hypothetical protein
MFHDARDGVQGAGVVGIFSGIAQRIAGFGLDLDLQAGLDDVERVDEGVGYDSASGTGDGQAPGRNFCFGESGHFVGDFFSLELLFRVEGCFGDSVYVRLGCYRLTLAPLSVQC